MNDSELLELAAKAIGYRFTLNHANAGWLCTADSKGLDGYVCFWKPLEDDGDALRLAAKLDLCVDKNICFVEVVWIDMVKSETHCVEEDWGAGEESDDVKMKFIRRAIVRAAAEIGKAMP